MNDGVIVADGRFRVFRDGRVNKIRNGVEYPAKKYFYGRYETVGFDNIRFYVHRLVASAFIPNPRNLPEVNHIDGNKKNNSFENLEWVTHADNVLHARKTGLLDPIAHGTNCIFCGSKTASKRSICSACASTSKARNWKSGIKPHQKHVKLVADHYGVTEAELMRSNGRE